jgi:hypothetical protein
MLTVYKYNVPLEDVIFLDLPEGAKILSFQVQHNRPTIWALVNSNAPKKRREFRIFGTGHPFSDVLDDELSFIGTCQMAGGELVWHLFELTESSDGDRRA